MPRYLSHIIIGVIYHPPNSNDFTMVSHIIDSLDDITRDHPASGIVLLVDFNHLRDSAILSFPLKQVAKDPTRCSSILDKIYTNADKWYSKPTILPPVGNSDHNAVLFVPTSPVVNVNCAATPMAYLYRSYDPKFLMVKPY